MSIRVEQHEKVLGHQAVGLMPYAWLEFVLNGHTDNWNIPFHEYDPVVEAYFDGVCVGFTTYRVSTNELWTVVSWVRPEHRKQGVYKALFAKIVEIAQDLGVARIGGGTSVNNEGMQAVYAKLSRRRNTESWVYDVPKKEIKNEG